MASRLASRFAGNLLARRAYRPRLDVPAFARCSAENNRRAFRGDRSRCAVSISPASSVAGIRATSRPPSSNNHRFLLIDYLVQHGSEVLAEAGVCRFTRHDALDRIVRGSCTCRHGFSGYIPELPTIPVTGSSTGELTARPREAIRLYRETLHTDHPPVRPCGNRGRTACIGHCLACDPATRGMRPTRPRAPILRLFSLARTRGQCVPQGGHPR